MVELQSRAALAQDADGDTKKGKKCAGTGGVGGGSKTYILRSFLDPALIALTNAPDRELRWLEAARAEPAHEDFTALYDDEDGEDGSTSTGTIFTWGLSNKVASIGILSLVLAFILVEGRVIRDRDLRQILKRLHLGPSTHIPHGARTTAAHTVDQLCCTYVRG